MIHKHKTLQLNKPPQLGSLLSIKKGINRNYHLIFLINILVFIFHILYSKLYTYLLFTFRFQSYYNVGLVFSLMGILNKWEKEHKTSVERELERETKRGKLSSLYFVHGFLQEICRVKCVLLDFSKSVSFSVYVFKFVCISVIQWIQKDGLLRVHTIVMNLF